MRMLERDGFDVLVAGTGREALAIAETQADALQLALLDVVMPDMTGPELARELRAHWPRMKVLFMSGHVSEEAGEAVEPTAHFIGKPFSAEVLERKVREVLGGNVARDG